MCILITHGYFLFNIKIFMIIMLFNFFQSYFIQVIFIIINFYILHCCMELPVYMCISDSFFFTRFHRFLKLLEVSLINNITNFHFRLLILKEAISISEICIINFYIFCITNV